MAYGSGKSKASKSYGGGNWHISINRREKSRNHVAAAGGSLTTSQLA